MDNPTMGTIDQEFLDAIHKRDAQIVGCLKDIETFLSAHQAPTREYLLALTYVHSAFLNVLLTLQTAHKAP